jgi:hypothetical protein
MLTEDADWDQPYWSIEPSFLASIAEAIPHIARQVQSPFTFIAGWDGDECSQVFPVTTVELGRIILAGHLARNTKYEVREA